MRLQEEVNLDFYSLLCVLKLHNLYKLYIFFFLIIVLDHLEHLRRYSLLFVLKSQDKQENIY